MDEDNNDIFIGSTLFTLKCAIRALKPFASTEKARITLDCLALLVYTFKDLDFQTNGANDNKTEGADE